MCIAKQSEHIIAKVLQLMRRLLRHKIHGAIFVATSTVADDARLDQFIELGTKLRKGFLDSLKFLP